MSLPYRRDGKNCIREACVSGPGEGAIAGVNDDDAAIHCVSGMRDEDLF